MKKHILTWEAFQPPDHPGTSLLCLLQYVSAFLVLGSPDWTQYSSCSPTNGSGGGGGTSDSTFVHTVGWGPSLLQGYTANLCSTCCPPGPPRSFLQCCSIAHHCPACPVTQDYSLIILSQVQDLHLPSLNVIRSCQPAKGPLNSSLPLQCINYFAQFGSICKLTERTLYTIIQAANEDIKQYCPQYQAPSWVMDCQLNFVL